MPRKQRGGKTPMKKELGSNREDEMISICEEFERGDAGASKTFPIQCSALRKGGHVMLKGQPCKIVEMSTSAPGKHGHAKVHIVGLEIFSGKKYEDICPSTHTMSVPHVKRAEYQVIGVWDEYITLLDNKGTARSDVRLPGGDVGKEIKERLKAEEEITVTLMEALDRERICGWKKLTK